MKRTALSIACVVAFGACTAAPTPGPTPLWQSVDGVRVACDPTPNPMRQLSCEAAARAGLPAAGYAASDIDFIEFHFGQTCTTLMPASPCPPAPPNLGYLVFHLRDGSAAALQVWALSNGEVFTPPGTPFPLPAHRSGVP